jgi:hypothetical protein
MNNNHIINIKELLKGRNNDFDNSKKIKFIRHSIDNDELHYQNKNFSGSLEQLYQFDYNEFIDFQNEQKVKYFKNVEYIVSFIGEEMSEARFIGVFKNQNYKDKNYELQNKESAIFNFQEVSGFEALKERVIIDWAKDRSWHLWYHKNEKYVIRIDDGFKSNNIPHFTRYEDVLLSYDELKKIIDTNNPEWKAKLEACNCVYLILDKSNGKQYVGVTYKDTSNGWKAGIWNRWSEYAKTGHGNDKKLKELCDDNPNYAKAFFQWSILEILPINVIPKVATSRETIYKEKLGTRNNENYNSN